jgi:hypothetical protein
MFLFVVQRMMVIFILNQLVIISQIKSIKKTLIFVYF